jgi:hypothetical protein
MRISNGIQQNGAQLVAHVFGIPGSKIDGFSTPWSIRRSNRGLPA